MKKRSSLFIFVVMFFIFPLSQFAQENVEPAGKSSMDSLLAAYKGEINAHARYLAFARVADDEGYGRVASLFRAVARAERVHYDRHANLIKDLGGAVPEIKADTPEVKTTKENLELSVKNETYESDTMYPEFLEKAENEKNKPVTEAFENAEDAESIHAEWFKEALNNLEAWKGGNKKEFFVCSVCGNVVDERPASCRICMADGEEFVSVH